MAASQITDLRGVLPNGGRIPIPGGNLGGEENVILCLDR